MEEEVLLETPLEKVEPYSLFKSALQCTMRFQSLEVKDYTTDDNTRLPTAFSRPLHRPDQASWSRGAVCHTHCGSASRPICGSTPSSRAANSAASGTFASAGPGTSTSGRSTGRRGGKYGNTGAIADWTRADQWILGNDMSKALVLGGSVFLGGYRSLKEFNE